MTILSTVPGLAAHAAAGALLGRRVRASVFRHGARGPGAARRHCPACATRLLPAGPAGLVAVLPRAGPGGAGRCPACRARIGPAAGVVELACGGSCLLLALSGLPPVALAAGCWLAVTGVALTAVDAAVHRLPDALTAGAFGGVVVALAAAGPGTLGRALLGALLLAGGYLAARLPARGGLGWGDCKLAPAVGATLGWMGTPALVVATAAACVGAALHGVGTALRGGVRRPAAVPFGPWMLAGALAVLAAA